MGTRGAVAFGNADEWHGVYSHSDSMPTILGPNLWKIVSAERARPDGLAGLRGRLLASGGVEAFLAGQASPEPLELSNATAQPLHISYVYVIVPVTSKLHVLMGDPRADVIPIDSLALIKPEAWHYVCLESYPLAGPEPDWRGCGAAWRLRNCERHIRSIRERFGEDAAASARREWLAK